MTDQDLIARIASALGTAETGDALVEVARNAHRAEMELASQYNDDQYDDPCTVPRVTHGSIPAPPMAAMMPAIMARAAATANFAVQTVMRERENDERSDHSHRC